MNGFMGAARVRRSATACNAPLKPRRNLLRLPRIGLRSGGGFMKWVLTVLLFLPVAALAQLPIPITPYWLKSGSDSDHAVLHSTQVSLTGNNYRLLHTNLIAR